MDRNIAWRQPTTYYYRHAKVWVGYWSDEEGYQIAPAVYAPTKDLVLIELGVQKAGILHQQVELLP